jgi:hypothetical protein
MNRVQIVSGALVLTVATACGSITDAGQPVDVRPYVTGAAAAALDVNGLFVFPEPTPPSVPIISAEVAGQQADAFLVSYGPVMKQIWDRHRNAPVDVNRMRRDSRMFYIDTPYEWRAVEGFSPVTERFLGPHYLTTFNVWSRPVVLIAISAYNHHVSIRPDGTISIPNGNGMEFLDWGIGRDTSLMRYESPEAAAVRAGRLTGALITEVPSLVRIGLLQTPLSAGWKFTLDRPVTVRVISSGRLAEVQEIHIGPDLEYRVFIPAPDQPVHFDAPFVRLDENGEPVGVEYVEIPVRPGYPTIFEAVTVVR